jgi:hypothetical protein
MIDPSIFIIRGEVKMRRICVVLSTLAMLVLFARSTLFGQLIQVCIDPGHGGLSASQYGNLQG